MIKKNAIERTSSVFYLSLPKHTHSKAKFSNYANIIFNNLLIFFFRVILRHSCVN